MLTLIAGALALTPAHTRVVAGPWTVEGQASEAWHVHGGRPATVSEARFRVELAGEPAELSVEKVEYLRGHSCTEPPTRIQATPEVRWLTDGSSHPGTTLKLQPGTHAVRVGFEGVAAYTTYCDRFVFRVTFKAGERRFVAAAETAVIREEPLRDELP